MTNWKPGDLALCVKGGSIIAGGGAFGRTPTAGAVYTVEWAAMMRFKTGTLLGIRFVDAPRNVDGAREWAALRFIKITPGADITGIEEPRRVPIKEEA